MVKIRSWLSGGSNSVSITKKGRLGSHVSTQRWPETPLGKRSPPDRPVLPGRKEELRSGSPQFLTVVAGLGGWLEFWKEQDQKVADTGMDKLSRWVHSLKIPTSLGIHTIRLWIMSFAQKQEREQEWLVQDSILTPVGSWHPAMCSVLKYMVHIQFLLNLKYTGPVRKNKKIALFIIP